MKKLFFVFLGSVVFLTISSMDKVNELYEQLPQKLKGLEGLIYFLNKFDAGKGWEYSGTASDLEKDFKELDENKVAAYALGILLCVTHCPERCKALSKYSDRKRIALFPFLQYIGNFFPYLDVDWLNKPEKKDEISKEGQEWWDKTNIKQFAQGLFAGEGIDFKCFFEALEYDPLYKKYEFLISEYDKPWDVIRKIWAAENAYKRKSVFLRYATYDFFEEDFVRSPIESIIAIKCKNRILNREYWPRPELLYCIEMYKNSANKSLDQLKAEVKADELALNRVKRDRLSMGKKLFGVESEDEMNKKDIAYRFLQVVGQSFVSQLLMKSGNSLKKNIFLSFFANSGMSVFLASKRSGLGAWNRIIKNALLAAAGSLGIKYGIRERLYPRLKQTFKLRGLRL